MPIWLSISDSPDLAARGLGEQHVRDALLEFARYVLTGGADIVYGGDLRVGGYTRTLFDLVDLHAAPLSGEPRPRIVNFLAWPRWQDLTAEDQQSLTAYVRFERGSEPRERPIDERHQNAMALTEMRRNAHHFVHDRHGAQVVMGGRLSGFSGCLPGLLEEVDLAVTAKTPVFVIGAFGGAAQEIGQAMFGKGNAERFESFSSRYPYPSSASIMARLRDYGDTAFRNGLSTTENRTLVETADIRLALRLMLKGLVEIANRAR
jgi:hypothetical protein